MSKRLGLVAASVGILVLALGAQAVADGVITSGLVSWWKFDEGEGLNAADTWHGNDGVISGAVWTAGSDGCYSGTLPEGDYSVAAAKRGWKYQGGGLTPTTNSATIASATPEVVDIELPNTATLTVTSVEETPSGTSAVPARVTVVGFDPSPEIVLSGNIGGPTGFDVETGLKLFLPFSPFSGSLFRYYEDAGGETPFGQPFGGEALRRVVSAYLQGSF